MTSPRKLRSRLSGCCGRRVDCGFRSQRLGVDLSLGPVRGTHGRRSTRGQAGREDRERATRAAPWQLRDGSVTIRQTA